MTPTAIQERGEPRVVLGQVILFAESQGGKDKAMRGDIVRLTEAEEERLDELGVLAPAGMTLEQAEEHENHKVDVFRGKRGDQEAFARALAHAQAAQPRPVDEIVNLEDQEATTGDLVEWLRSAQPTADQVLQRVGDDPVMAAKMLEAEQTATDGSPRQNVEKALGKVIQDATG